TPGCAYIHRGIQIMQWPTAFCNSQAGDMKISARAITGMPQRLDLVREATGRLHSRAFGFEHRPPESVQSRLRLSGEASSWTTLAGRAVMVQQGVVIGKATRRRLG